MIKRIVVLAVLLAITACACQPPYEGPSGSKVRVAVVGDSITDQSTAPLRSNLTKRWMTSVNGVGGIDLPKGRVKLVQPAVATKPNVLVIELGINSASNGWTSDDAHFIDLILRDAAKVPCVVWVQPDSLDNTMFNEVVQDGLKMTDRVALLKKSIQRRLPAHPNLHFADYGVVERTHPEWYEWDGMHPNADGEAAYAAFVQQSITKYC